jgi:peroxiredoxin
MTIYLGKNSAMSTSTEKPSAVTLGTPAPDFELPALDGPIVKLSDFANAPAFLVAFLSDSCPYSRHIEQALGRVCGDFSQAVLATVAICSSDTEARPEDDVEHLWEQAERGKFWFPYLIDETQEIAKAYKAERTPEFFLYDENRKLVYHGQLDASRPDNDIPPDGKLFRTIVEHVLFGEPLPDEPQIPTEGTPIAWKPGNAPGEN